MSVGTGLVQRSTCLRIVPDPVPFTLTLATFENEALPLDRRIVIPIVPWHRPLFALR